MSDNIYCLCRQKYPGTHETMGELLGVYTDVSLAFAHGDDEHLHYPGTLVVWAVKPNDPATRFACAWWNMETNGEERLAQEV